MVSVDHQFTFFFFFWYQFTFCNSRGIWWSISYCPGSCKIFSLEAHHAFYVCIKGSNLKSGSHVINPSLRRLTSPGEYTASRQVYCLGIIPSSKAGIWPAGVDYYGLFLWNMSFGIWTISLGIPSSWLKIQSVSSLWTWLSAECL